MSCTSPVARFAKACVEGRLVDPERLKPNGPDLESKSEPRRSDLLSMFLKAKEDCPDFFHDGRVLTMAVSMSFAGSDTTAISLSAVFYYLLKNPQCYRKLMLEIDTAIKVGDIQNRFTGLVTWAESQRLPYLDACIKEAFRLHPAVGLPLERIVPAGGAEILGERVAAGTIVGCSAWVIHRRPEVFGEDADSYRPERWIDADHQSRKEMEGGMFHFGMGARTCIGKNISLLEIYKVVPAFLRSFEVRVLNFFSSLLTFRLAACAAHLLLSFVSRETRVANSSAIIRSTSHIRTKNGSCITHGSSSNAISSLPSSEDG